MLKQKSRIGSNTDHNNKNINPHIITHGHPNSHKSTPRMTSGTRTSNHNTHPPHFRSKYSMAIRRENPINNNNNNNNNTSKSRPLSIPLTQQIQTQQPLFTARVPHPNRPSPAVKLDYDPTGADIKSVLASIYTENKGKRIFASHNNKTISPPGYHKKNNEDSDQEENDGQPDYESLVKKSMVARLPEGNPYQHVYYSQYATTQPVSYFDAASGKERVTPPPFSVLPTPPPTFSYHGAVSKAKLKPVFNREMIRNESQVELLKQLSLSSQQQQQQQQQQTNPLSSTPPQTIQPPLKYTLPTSMNQAGGSNLFEVYKKDPKSYNRNHFAEEGILKTKKPLPRLPELGVSAEPSVTFALHLDHHKAIHKMIEFYRQEEIKRDQQTLAKLNQGYEVYIQHTLSLERSNPLIQLDYFFKHQNDGDRLKADYTTFLLQYSEMHKLPDRYFDALVYRLNTPRDDDIHRITFEQRAVADFFIKAAFLHYTVAKIAPIKKRTHLPIGLEYVLRSFDLNEVQYFPADPQQSPLDLFSVSSRPVDDISVTEQHPLWVMKRLLQRITDPNPGSEPDSLDEDLETLYGQNGDNEDENQIEEGQQSQEGDEDEVDEDIQSDEVEESHQDDNPTTGLNAQQIDGIVNMLSNGELDPETVIENFDYGAYLQNPHEYLKTNLSEMSSISDVEREIEKNMSKLQSTPPPPPSSNTNAH